MSPSFLNSNSTSHTWPFSAVAELIGRWNLWTLLGSAHLQFSVCLLQLFCGLFWCALPLWRTAQHVRDFVTESEGSTNFLIRVFGVCMSSASKLFARAWYYWLLLHFKSVQAALQSCSTPLFGAKSLRLGACERMKWLIYCTSKWQCVDSANSFLRHRLWLKRDDCLLAAGSKQELVWAVQKEAQRHDCMFQAVMLQNAALHPHLF